MKRFSVSLAMLLALPIQSLHAAFQNLPVQTQQIIIEDGVRRCEITRPSYGFRVEIISDLQGLKTEDYRHGRSFITVQPEERYAVRLYNPLPVRVAVNLTVDGINSISGRPSGIADGETWLIHPHSVITIRGWQVNGAEARRFFFTEKPKSYAKWRGDKLGKELSKNCGVIGAAYFWSQKELDAYYEKNPQVRYSPRPPEHRTQSNAYWQGTELSNAGRQSTQEARDYQGQFRQRIKEKAGTGMGERESHATQSVEFNYDTGMYRLSQAVVIYYDFAETPVPNPFPALSYAPEMP